MAQDLENANFIPETRRSDSQQANPMSAKTKGKRGRPRKKDKQKQVNRLTFDPLGDDNDTGEPVCNSADEIDEGNRTCYLGRLVLMQSSNDNGVISALRRSQRRPE